MNTKHEHHSPELVEQSRDTDTDLRQVFVGLWSKRYVIAFVVLLMTTVFGSLLAVSRLALPSTQTYQSVAKLVFLGAKEGRYPNNAQFSLTDVIAPAVLERVYTANQLGNHGVSDSAFSGALSIAPYSENYAYIADRYHAKLNNKRLTFVQREKIEEEMRKELDNNVSGKAILRMTLNQRIAIPRELGIKVLNDIWKSWAQVSTKQLGVLRYGESYSGAQLIDTEILKNLDYPIAYDWLLQAYNKVSERATALQELQDETTVVDEKTEHTIASLFNSIQNFKAYELDPLAVTIFHLGVSRTPEAAKFYYESRVASLLIEKETFENKALAVKAGSSEYSSQSQVFSSAANGSKSDQGISVPAKTSILQSGDAFLEKIMALSDGNEDREYRQKLINEQIDIRKQAVTIDVSLRHAKYLYSKIDPEKMRSNQVSGRGPANEKIVKEKLPVIAKRLDAFWQTSSRLFEALSHGNLNSIGRLYVPLKLPPSSVVVEHHPVWNKSVLSMVGISMLLMTCLAIVLVLVWELVRFGRIRIS